MWITLVLGADAEVAVEPLAGLLEPERPALAGERARRAVERADRVEVGDVLHEQLAEQQPRRRVDRLGDRREVRARDRLLDLLAEREDPARATRTRAGAGRPRSPPRLESRRRGPPRGRSGGGGRRRASPSSSAARARRTGRLRAPAPRTRPRRARRSHPTGGSRCRRPAARAAVRRRVPGRRRAAPPPRPGAGARRVLAAYAMPMHRGHCSIRKLAPWCDLSFSSCCSPPG